MSDAQLLAASTAGRKQDLLRLRTRLKWAIGAYHLLRDGQPLPYPTFDGLTAAELRDWTDEVIDALRGKYWLQHFFLVHLCVSASEANRRVLNKGLSTENVSYEPNISIYTTNHKMPEDEAWREVNSAVDLAIRYWLDMRKKR